MLEAGVLGIGFHELLHFLLSFRWGFRPIPCCNKQLFQRVNLEQLKHHSGSISGVFPRGYRSVFSHQRQKPSEKLWGCHLLASTWLQSLQVDQALRWMSVHLAC